MDNKTMTCIEPWYEPLDMLKEKIEFECDMSRKDHGFLCGIINMVRPKKVLEIGVAEGGTTGVIMNSLSLLDLKSKMYSVDLNERFYHNKDLRTGYEYDKLSKIISNRSEHKFLFGRTVAGQIENIGNDIDLVVIDTTHRLPGEILDFLAVLPFLKKNAIVVIHDINLNYFRAINGTENKTFAAREDIATKILLTTVVADKYICENNIMAANIAAFQINEDTVRYIENVFLSLTLSWSYNLGEMTNEYREIFCKYYSEKLVNLFDIAVTCNKRMIERKRIVEAANDKEIEIMYFQFPYERIPRGSNVALYGAGCVGKEMYSIMQITKYCNCVGWFDKKYKELSSKGLAVENPTELSNYKYDCILIAVESEDLYEEIRHEILENVDYQEHIVGPIKRW